MSSWQNLLKNKRQLVKWLLAVLIPVLLVVGFLGTINYQTQQLNGLRVAIVNLDKGGQYRGKQQNIGANFAGELSQKKTFRAVTYATRQKAETALSHGEVSAVVIIPANLTRQLPGLNKSGKNISIQQLVASGQSKIATQYIQTELMQALNRENTRLISGTADSSILSSLANQSQSLSKQAKDLQVNLQAVGNGVDTQTASDLQDKVRDQTTKLANYSAQLNAAISANDTEKISEMASEINDVSYTMQTTIAGGVDSIVANLNNVKAMSDESGIIQSSANDIQNGQSSIADKLKESLGQQTSSNNQSPLTQTLIFNIKDLQPIKQDGQSFLPNVLVVGVTILSLLFGLMLPVKSTKQEALALEQWWETFQIGGVFSAIAVALMVFGAGFWQISIENFWAVAGTTLLASWVVMSIVWYLKQVLGQAGWWLASLLMTLQTIFAVIAIPGTMTTGFFGLLQSIWPLATFNRAINQIIFGGDVQQNLIVLVLWLLVFTILLVTYYRIKQRRNFKATLSN